MSTRKMIHRFPSIFHYKILWFAQKTEDLTRVCQCECLVEKQSWVQQSLNRLHASTRYAMMLNYLMAAFYIIVGTFNSLVTFIGRFADQ